MYIWLYNIYCCKAYITIPKFLMCIHILCMCTHQIPQLTLFLLQARQQKVSRETGSRSSWYTGCRFFFQTLLDRPLLPAAWPYLATVLLGSSSNELCL